MEMIGSFTLDFTFWAYISDIDTAQWAKWNRKQLQPIQKNNCNQCLRTQLQIFTKIVQQKSTSDPTAGPEMHPWQTSKDVIVIIVILTLGKCILFSQLDRILNIELLPLSMIQ